MTTKHMRITGRVQGVGFRYSMLNAANQLGIRGWVKNCRDGAVEAVVQADNSAIEKILAWARQGPPLSEVDHVEVTDTIGDFHDFRIL